MKKILVAVDETEAPRRAGEFVEELFAGKDYEITAINVARTPVDTTPVVPYGGMFAWRWPVGLLPAAPAELQEERARGEVRARDIAAEQAPPGATPEARFGNPVDEIRAAAAEWDADLIVVGSNDKGFLDRQFSGSVSEELARGSSRPVLIVR